jgi:hypothetical protein
MTSPALIFALSITFDRFMRAVTVESTIIVRKITHVNRFAAGGMNGHTKESSSLSALVPFIMAESTSPVMRFYFYC